MNQLRGPHYNLPQVQATVAARGVECFTKSSLDGIRAMGLTTEEALAVIAGLKRSQCVKTMTTHNDHTVWQDVYNAPTPAGDAYIKFTLRTENDSVVISFKEL